MPNKLLSKRIFPGFTFGEVLLWLLFHVSWALLLTIIYYVLGKFNGSGPKTFSAFAQIQGIVLSGKALFLLPFWWLFFIRLRNTTLFKKIILHLITSPLYVACCLGFFYFMLNNVLHGIRYGRNDMLNDIYFLLFTYTSHFALFHAYNFWLDTQRQMKKEMALKELAHQSEIKALKSQIEPHFLFNTLNSISASVPPHMEKTRILIAQLADTFRHALQTSEKPFVTLEEELDFLRNWLSLEKHRFNNRLAVHFELNEEIMQTKIPPMILQPLVENALNHGIAPKLTGGSVTIQCKRKGAFAEIAVSDTGVGYKADLNKMFTEGIGLSNVSKRLQLLYNQTLRVERNPEGLRLSFRVPLIKVYEKEGLHY